MSLIDKNRNNIYIILNILVLLCIVFLCFHFFPIGDDLAFASVIEHNSESIPELITENGVNGRYLGNLFGKVFSYLSMSDFWWIKFVFDLLIIVLLLFFSTKCVSDNKDFFKAFFYIAAGLFASNKYHYLEYFGYSAGFMNYLLPLTIFIIDFYLIKEYLRDSKRKTRPFICLIAFFNCLFIEHMTVYMLLCSFGFFLYSILTKKSKKLAIPLFFSVFLGTSFMFSYPIFCYSPEITYRQSVFSNGLRLIFENITDNAALILFDHLFLTAAIACVSCIVFYNTIRDWRKQKLFSPGKITGIIIILTIMGIGCMCSFCNYFGNWSGTFLEVLTSKNVIAFLSITYVIAFGAVLFFYTKKDATIAFLYFSVCFLFCMLSAVSPLGPRCFLASYMFLVIITTKTWITASADCNIILKIAVPSVFVVCVFSYLFGICKSYYQGNEIQKERFLYIEKQMTEGATSITIPESVNFTDCGGLRFMPMYFYYSEPGDIQFDYIPYDEWLSTFCAE